MVTCLVTEVYWLAMSVRYGIAKEANKVKEADSCMMLDGYSNKASKELQPELSTVR